MNESLRQYALDQIEQFRVQLVEELRKRSSDQTVEVKLSVRLSFPSTKVKKIQKPIGKPKKESLATTNEIEKLLGLEELEGRFHSVIQAFLKNGNKPISVAVLETKHELPHGWGITWVNKQITTSSIALLAHDRPRTGWYGDTHYCLFKVKRPGLP